MYKDDGNFFLLLTPPRDAIFLLIHPAGKKLSLLDLRFTSGLFLSCYTLQSRRLWRLNAIVQKIGISRSFFVYFLAG
jgi:hypothetical protein